MPIGLTMNYVVFRKDRLEAARMAALGRHDLQAAEYIDNMKLNGVQDEHLLGLESMAPFEDEDFAMWTERLGLTWHANDGCVDFYLPSVECPRATWLEESPICDIPASASQTSLPIYDGFRFAGDKTRQVKISSLNTRKPVDFPEIAQTVGPENFVGIDWDALLETSPEWAKWRPV
jgi:hypothetical protein